MTPSPLEPFNATQSDLLHWCKHYMCEKLRTLRSSKIKEGFDADAIAKAISQSETIAQLREASNEAARFGLKALGSKMAHLGEFYDHISSLDLPKLSRMESTHIESMFASESMATREESTRHNYALTLNNFFNFIEENSLERHRFRFKTTHAAPQASSRSSEAPAFLPPQDFIRFSELIETKEYPSEFERCKNLLIVKLILLGGLKSDEISALRLGDINNDGSAVYVGAERRKVMLPAAKIAPWLICYLKTRERNLTRSLFYSPSNKEIPLHPDRINWQIGKLLDFCQINHQRGGAQMLRNSYAAFLIHSGVSLRSVQELMGIENIASLLPFASIAPKDRFNPEKVFG